MEHSSSDSEPHLEDRLARGYGSFRDQWGHTPIHPLGLDSVHVKQPGRANQSTSSPSADAPEHGIDEFDLRLLESIRPKTKHRVLNKGTSKSHTVSDTRTSLFDHTTIGAHVSHDMSVDTSKGLEYASRPPASAAGSRLEALPEREHRYHSFNPYTRPHASL